MSSCEFTPAFTSLSTTLLASRLMCDVIRVRVGLRRAFRLLRGPRRRQLGVIFSGSFPVMILVARLMMNMESHSFIRQVRLWSKSVWIPLISPHIFAELFVSCPRLSANRYYIWPMLSRITTPYPKRPGLPLEAPSKLTLWKLGGGGSHKEGLGDDAF